MPTWWFISQWLQDSLTPFLAECENKETWRLSDHVIYIDQVCPYDDGHIVGTIAKRLHIDLLDQSFIRYMK